MKVLREERYLYEGYVDTSGWYSNDPTKIKRICGHVFVEIKDGGVSTSRVIVDKCKYVRKDGNVIFFAEGGNITVKKEDGTIALVRPRSIDNARLSGGNFIVFDEITAAKS